MYYDPFANLDPDMIQPFTPADRPEKPETPVFDPAANEFHPVTKDLNVTSSSVEEEEEEGEGEDERGNKENVDENVGDDPQWQVVAAEYGGKAVAVVVQDGKIYACSSPFFNSKCSHPGLNCLAWDSVVLELDKETRDTSLASESPQPEGAYNFTDSGFENGFETFTDNSSEQSGDGILQHMSEPPYIPTVDVTNLDMELEQYNHQYGASYQQVYPSPVELMPHGYTTSLPEAIALAPDTVVVEHYPQPIVVAEHQYEAWVNPDHSCSPISWSAGLGLTIPTLAEDGINAYTTDSSSTFSSSTYAEFGQVGPLSPTGQTQFIQLGGLNAGMAALELGKRRETSEEDRLNAREEQRKRDEFKKKVLYNLSGSTEERKEMKIRDSFKDQVLSNLRKEQQQKESDEQKIKRAFKDKILSNLGDESKT